MVRIASDESGAEEIGEEAIGASVKVQGVHLVSRCERRAIGAIASTVE